MAKYYLLRIQDGSKKMIKFVTSNLTNKNS